MSNINFSGLFTLNSTDKQAGMAARLDAQSAAEKRLEAIATAKDTEPKSLPLSFVETTTEDKFYMETSAVSAPKGTKKDYELEFFDKRLKNMLKENNIPFEYTNSRPLSPTRRPDASSDTSILGRITKRLF